jgi:alkanesulfonate monooxygenase SsuD/methylene tetrahydromethanopterin reductase-like flavin-dependent oxidoreductase (luciferase family)
VITAMLAGDKHQHASFDGRYSSVRNAINVPKPIQRPRVPIMVGGNGPNVTWRLAARFADELNVDGLTPQEVREALPTIRGRCEEIDRDPATLAISVHVWTETASIPGRQRVDLLARYRDIGVDRVMGLDKGSATSDEALHALAEDARAAGVDLALETAEA